MLNAHHTSFPNKNFYSESVQKCGSCGKFKNYPNLKDLSARESFSLKGNNLLLTHSQPFITVLPTELLNNIEILSHNKIRVNHS